MTAGRYTASHVRGRQSPRKSPSVSEEPGQFGLKGLWQEPCSVPFLRSAEAELRRPEAGVTLGNPGTGGAVGRWPGRGELCGEARRGQRRPRAARGRRTQKPLVFLRNRGTALRVRASSAGMRGRGAASARAAWRGTARGKRRPWREKPGSCLSVAHASGNATARAAPHFRPLLPGPLDLVSDAFPWFSRHPGPQSRWLSWGATQGTLSGAVPQPAQVPAMPASAKESGCCISGVPSAFE